MAHAGQRMMSAYIQTIAKTAGSTFGNLQVLQSAHHMASKFVPLGIVFYSLVGTMQLLPTPVTTPKLGLIPTSACVRIVVNLNPRFRGHLCLIVLALAVTNALLHNERELLEPGIDDSAIHVSPGGESSGAQIGVMELHEAAAIFQADRFRYEKAHSDDAPTSWIELGAFGHELARHPPLGCCNCPSLINHDAFAVYVSLVRIFS
ncbi:hypothetical protein FRC08_015476 [Ceratobasidium sp. 394]|nr:hypothetical protein FRC08_015476 [Ceratobasidium sp. 394]